MTRKSQVEKKSRRTFLKELAVAGGAAAVASAATTASAEPTPVASNEKPNAKGYHLTPHINRYYQKARF